MPVDRGSPPYIVNPVHGFKNNVSRALRVMALNQGWDPDKIVDTKTGEVVASMTNWDKDPGPDTYGHKTVGDLPEGTPDSFPESVAPNVGQETTWEFPAHSDGNAPPRRTTGADPFPAKPGAA